jgi:hypothetical protein
LKGKILTTFVRIHLSSINAFNTIGLEVPVVDADVVDEREANVPRRPLKIWTPKWLYVEPHIVEYQLTIF